MAFLCCQLRGSWHLQLHIRKIEEFPVDICIIIPGNSNSIIANIHWVFPLCSWLYIYSCIKLHNSWRIQCYYLCLENWDLDKLRTLSKLTEPAINKAGSARVIFLEFLTGQGVGRHNWPSLCLMCTPKSKVSVCREPLGSHGEEKFPKRKGKVATKQEIRVHSEKTEHQ